MIPPHALAKQVEAELEEMGHPAGRVRAIADPRWRVAVHLDSGGSPSLVLTPDGKWVVPVPTRWWDAHSGTRVVSLDDAPAFDTLREALMHYLFTVTE